MTGRRRVARMSTTGTRHAATAPTKKIVWWELKSVTVATATGIVLPAIAKRRARLRCLPLNRIGAAITRPSATRSSFDVPWLLTLREEVGRMQLGRNTDWRRLDEQRASQPASAAAMNASRRWL